MGLLILKLQLIFSYFTTHVANDKGNDQTHLCWSDSFILIKNKKLAAAKSALMILQDKTVKLWVSDFCFTILMFFEVKKEFHLKFALLNLWESVSYISNN